ncbi:DUF1206 domain-containing protein [Agromyces seonyuensis]|uniref:DUF1206 domain-containing protein n=1 Tax=Agromyces seonyuensis TaxID=2662446 RepID=A0A6I4P062_9MICO|nr:DUF1206 domain-containing protein [Agromyces seonyuensis]MWB99926.1 DUF1206 domain-containing protein [Agromyces seonyuensis]
MVKTEARRVAQQADRSPVLTIAARVGFAMLGLLHLLIGILAIAIAVGAGGQEADQSGALEQVAAAPLGGVLLWVVALGLLALGLWQLLEGVLVRESEPTKKWGRRAAEWGKAIAYLAIGVLALGFALGSRSSSSESSQRVSGELLSTPGGVFVLVLVGLATLGIGIGFVVIGVRRTFAKQLRLPAGAARGVVLGTGVVGYVAKGIALAAAGVLFVVAALTGDPEAAGGIDAGLRSLADLPAGEVLLWLTGLGLIVYGGYCGLRSWFGRF